MIVNCCQSEPTLEDILSDSIIKAVMKADGVDPHQLAAMLKEVGRRCSRGHANDLPAGTSAAVASIPSTCSTGRIVRRSYSQRR